MYIIVYVTVIFVAMDAFAQATLSSMMNSVNNTDSWIQTSRRVPSCPITGNCRDRELPRTDLDLLAEAKVANEYGSACKASLQLADVCALVVDVKVADDDHSLC